MIWCLRDTRSCGIFISSPVAKVGKATEFDSVIVRSNRTRAVQSFKAKQKGDKWYFRITLTVGDGSHKYIERGGFKTKKEALDAGNRLEVQYKDGEDISRPKFMSFNFLHDEWLTNYHALSNL